MAAASVLWTGGAAVVLTLDLALALVAAAFFALHKGTETTLDQLQEEHGGRYNRREIRGICEAADQDLYGEFDPTTGTVKWFLKRGKPTQTSLMGLLESE